MVQADDFLSVGQTARTTSTVAGTDHSTLAVRVLRPRACQGSGSECLPVPSVHVGLHFAGVTELVILISMKAGKTTLFAALACRHRPTATHPSR